MPTLNCQATLYIGRLSNSVGKRSLRPAPLQGNCARRWVVHRKLQTITLRFLPAQSSCYPGHWSVLGVWGSLQYFRWCAFASLRFGDTLYSYPFFIFSPQSTSAENMMYSVCYLRSRKCRCAIQQHHYRAVMPKRLSTATFFARSNFNLASATTTSASATSYSAS